VSPSSVEAAAEAEAGTGATGVFVAEPGRFHLYSGWFCPWAHRSTLVLALAGLASAVSVSYVDGARDARGWAFRSPTGPDPVNGFTLLREAYEATEPGFDGHVSVPALWDRRTRQVVSNDYGTLDADLAAGFQDSSRTGVDLYPADLRQEIDELDLWLGPTVNHGVKVATRSGSEGRIARDRVRAALTVLERTFKHSRYLLGERLTLADVRLFVTLVRYDVGPNAKSRIGPRLSEYSHLWAYARDLYSSPPSGRPPGWAASPSRVCPCPTGTPRSPANRETGNRAPGARPGRRGVAPRCLAGARGRAATPR
jgi:putative glutathione S-transferase